MSKEQKEPSTTHRIDLAEVYAELEELRRMSDMSIQKLVVRAVKDGLGRTRARIEAFNDDGPSAPPLPPAANGAQPAPPVRH